MTDVETLVGVKLKHSIDYSPKFWAIFIGQRWILSLSDSLKEVVKRKVFLIVLPKWTPEHAQLVGNASKRPHI
jgi:hypothetical protein